MQAHGGAAAEAAITGAERSIRASVSVDWDNNGLFDHALSKLDRFVISVDLDRSLTGSAPQEILLIEGSSSAELTMEIHGDYNGVSLMSVFSPFSNLGPFIGIQTINCELKYSILVDTPVGTFEYPQFIGNIRTITPNRAEGTVTITALDRAEKMRKPIQLAPFAVSDEHIAYGEIDSQLIRPQWVIDNALRLCDCGVSDKRPSTKLELGLANDALDGVLVWVTGNGSYLPTIGYLDNLNIDSFPNPGVDMFVQTGPLHPDVPADTPPPLALAGLGTPISHSYGSPSHQGLLRYWVADQDRLAAQAVHYLGCTLNLKQNKTPVSSISAYQLFEIVLGESWALRVRVQNGQLRMERFDDDSVTPQAATAYMNIPTNQDHVDIFLMWDMTPGRSHVYMRAGSNLLNNGNWTAVGSPITSGTYDPLDQIKGRFSLGQGISMSDAFYGTSNQLGKAPNDTAQVFRKPTYHAVLDQGLNRFTHIPNAQRQEAWQLVQDVASAEFGSIFWDENGVLRFWNWKTMLAKRDNVVRTLSLDQVENLVLTNNLDSVRNIYTVKTTKKRSLGILKVYESQDPMEFYVPARTTSRFMIWIDETVSPLTWYMDRYRGAESTRLDGTPGAAIPPWSDGLVSGYVVQYYNSDGTWTEDDAGYTPLVTAYFTSNGYVTLRVENGGTRDIRLSQGWAGGNPPTPVASRLHIGGTKYLDASELTLEYVNEESVKKYGPRTLDLSGDWYQDALWSTDLLSVVAPRTGEPVPTTDAITIAGDPRLQLGDVITVTDYSGFGDMQLQIFGISRSFHIDDGLTDTLTVEMVPPPGPPPTTDPTDPPPGPEITRYNLCPNPSLGRNSQDWWAGSRVSVSGMDRPYGYQVSTEAIGPKTDVRRGNTYRFSAQVRGTSGSSTVTAYVHWYSRGGYLSSTPGASFTVPSGGNVRVSTVAAVAPLGATQALLYIDGFDNTAVVTATLYEETDQIRPYFDGDTPGGKWDGAAQNSESRITQAL